MKYKPENVSDVKLYMTVPNKKVFIRMKVNKKFWFLKWSKWEIINDKKKHVMLFDNPSLATSWLRKNGFEVYF